MMEGKIESKGSSDEPTPFEMYYEYSEDVSKIPAHRILAINRGEKEKVLSRQLYLKLHLWPHLQLVPSFHHLYTF